MIEILENIKEKAEKIRLSDSCTADEKKKQYRLLLDEIEKHFDIEDITKRSYYQSVDYRDAAAQRVYHQILTLCKDSISNKKNSIYRINTKKDDSVMKLKELLKTLQFDQFIVRYENYNLPDVSMELYNAAKDNDKSVLKDYLDYNVVALDLLPYDVQEAEMYLIITIQ